MDYEKLYKEALERARISYESYKDGLARCKDKGSNAAYTLRGAINALEEQYPELKESEDEKIRKEIIQALRDHFGGEECDRCVAWLEKQKPAEWNNCRYENIKDILKEILRSENCPYPTLQDDLDWYLSIRPQPKQEWSEEDEEEKRMLIRCLEGLKYCEQSKADMQHYINWLRTLRPQSHWKPSEEQMTILNDVIKNAHLSCANEAGLIGLYNDLKKLTE